MSSTRRADVAERGELGQDPAQRHALRERDLAGTLDGDAVGHRDR